jgi:ligand-binding sensor domain-containing protein
MNKIYVILFFVFTLVGTSSSQSPFFKEYSLGELYKDVRVNNAFERKNGYLWFGTTKGVFRYDGLQFEQFLMPDSITKNQVSAIYEDHKNKLWIGYKDGNIFYESDRNKFIKWEPEEGTPKVPITSFYEDEKGDFWIATYGEGLYVFKQNRLYNFNSDDGLPGDDIYSMAIDKNENIWIGTDGGIAQCAIDEKQKSVEIFSTADGLPDNIVRTILPDENGNFWIGMHDGGVCYFDPYDKKVTTSFSNRDLGIVNALEIFEERELWIGTEGNGVFRLDLKEEKIKPIRLGLAAEKAKIYDLHKDVEGNIWVVSNTNGVCSANRQFEIVQRSIPQIQALIVDSDDHLWVGTQTGLFLHELNDEGESNFKPILKNQNVLSLFEDKFKNLWVGTFGEGVFCLDVAKNQTRQLTEKDGLTNGSILSIEGENSKIWLATLGGVTEIENERNIFSNSNLKIKKLNQETGLGTNYIYTVFIDSKGRTWFGTDSKGVSVLENGKITNYTHADSLPLNTVSSITEDRLGHIWLSTEKEGIFEFDGEKFHHLTIKEGIRDLAITSLISDVKDNILVIHPSGIDLLDPITNHLIYYDAEIGVENIDPNLNVVCNDKNGNIWIGTQDRLIRYTALKETLEIHPRTQLNEVSVLLDPIDFQIVTTFKHNQNSLIFDYVGLWYTDPTTVKYRYKLEGVNHDWVISRDRQATYSNLPPGEYTFSVTSTENDAFAKEPVVSYSFEIKAPIWMQPWFLILSMLVIAALIYFIIKERERQLERQADLRKERIESQFELLKSQINPHFLFNNFNTLVALIEEDRPHAIEYVERLSDFYRSILHYREKDLIQIHEEFEIIKNYEFLLHKRYGDNIELTINSNGNLSDAYIVPLTLQMLVENAVKHNVISKSKPLTIEITKEKDQYISITNNCQKKLTNEPSTGFGLHSIQSRYALLSKKEVEIEESEDQFKVRIPILKK